MNDRPVIRFGVGRLTGNEPYQFLGWVTANRFTVVEVHARTREAARTYRDLDFSEWQQTEKDGVEQIEKAGQPTTGATT